MVDEAAGSSEFPDAPSHSLNGNDHSVLPHTAQQLWVYAGLPLLVLGTVQHLLSLLVLLGSRRMRTLPLSVYLVATALSGLAALYVGLLRQILLRLDGYGKDVRVITSDAGCRMHAALTYFSLQLFSWLQACVAVERLIAVWRPLRYHHWCTWKRNLITVCVIAFVLACLNIIVIDSYGRDKHVGCIPLKIFLFDHVWGILDLALFSLIPNAVMVPCNALTAIGIFKSEYYRNNKFISVNHRRSGQFTIMLLVHNILCVLTTLPISVIFLLPVWSFNQGSPESNARIMEWTIFSLLQYLGTTLDFTVYSILARKFRKATSDLFCKGFYARVTSLDSTSHISLHSTAGQWSLSRRARTRGNSIREGFTDRTMEAALQDSLPL